MTLPAYFQFCKCRQSTYFLRLPCVSRLSVPAPPFSSLIARRWFRSVDQRRVRPACADRRRHLWQTDRLRGCGHNNGHRRLPVELFPAGGKPVWPDIYGQTVWRRSASDQHVRRRHLAAVSRVRNSEHGILRLRNSAKSGK